MTQPRMSKPCRRALPVPLAAVLALALTAVPAAIACQLPLDPYVVALPDEVKVGGVTYPVDQFHGWVNNPVKDPDYNDQDVSGFIVVPAGAQVTWSIYWDPTEGGANPGALGQLNIPINKAQKQGFQILKSPPVSANLFDLSLADSLALQSFKKPMKVKEVYARTSSTGTWDGAPAISGAGINKYRVTAPWVIPGNAKFDIIKQEDGTPFTPSTMGLDKDSKIAAGRGWGQDPKVGGWLEKMFGPDPTYTAYASYPASTPPAQPGGAFQWVMVGQPSWTDDGGTWEFNKVKGRWKINPKHTAKTNQTDVDIDGLTMKYTFDTPTEPFFYLVKPIGTFEFNLVSGDKYQWTERKIIYDATGNVTASPSPGLPALEPDNVVSLTASGTFSKGSSGTAGGPPTLVMVQDSTPPLHVHLNTAPGQPSFTAPVGGSFTDASGTVKYTMVDDNPYGGYPYAAASPWPGFTKNAGCPPLKFDKGNLKADFYYSMPVTDFAMGELPQLAPLLVAPEPEFAMNTSGALNTFPYVKERWKWFKGPQITDLDVVGSPPIKEDGTVGAVPTNLYGNGQNPSFSTAEFTVKPALFDNPAPGHHLATSKQVTNPDNSILEQGEKRMKFFILPTDASGNATTLNADGSGFAAEVLPTGNKASMPDGSITAKAPLPADQYITGASPLKVPAVPAPPANLVLSALVPGCNHDKSNLGNMGFADVTQDAVRPSVVVLVKDTKYDRTYIMNDQQQGWWAHKKILDGTLTTEDNTDWPDAVSPAKDIEKITFGSPAGGSNPADFTNHVTNGWAAFTPPATRDGLYVDEDTRLLFQVLAWDNVSWKTTPIPPDKVHWTFKDVPSNVSPDPNESTVPDLANGKLKFEYVFRDPNWGPGVLPNQECSLTVNVEDASANHREVVIQFFVASNKLKILTLEEKRGNK